MPIAAVEKRCRQSSARAIEAMTLLGVALDVAQMHLRDPATGTRVSSELGPE